MHNLKICNGFENWHYFAFPLASHIKSSSSFQIKSLKSFIRHKLQYWTANYFLWKYKQICKIICLLSSSHPISVLRLAHGLWRHLYSNRTAALMTHNWTKILMKLYFFLLYSSKIYVGTFIFKRVIKVGFEKIRVPNTWSHGPNLGNFSIWLVYYLYCVEDLV